MRSSRKEKKRLKEQQSSRELMGITELTENGIMTSKAELVFFLIRPDNLSVLSSEGIAGRVRALTELLRTTESVKMLALDSRESFQKNKLYYQMRLEEEDNPDVRKLLKADMEHLDRIQTSAASAREFALVYTLNRQGEENLAGELSRMEKSIRDRGFHVRLAGKQDIRRILSVYYQQDAVTEVFPAYDGEEYAIGREVEDE